MTGDVPTTADPTRDLAALLDRAGHLVPDPEEARGAREILGMSPHTEVLTKGRLADWAQCEAFMVARANRSAPDPTSREDEPSWSSLRGSALDAYVTHATFAGPVADPLADAASIHITRGDPVMAAAITELGDRERCDELARLAAAARGLEVDPAWQPRTEVRMAGRVGGIEVRGRVDLLLGGPGTGRPAVVVEVKSGSVRGEHDAELHLYALLCALRHGASPAAMAVWYPDRTVRPVHVPGAAEAAARRCVDAAEVLAQLRAGRAPRTRPGACCGWCPLAGECPSAAVPGDGGDMRDDHDRDIGEFG